MGFLDKIKKWRYRDNKATDNNKSDAEKLNESVVSRRAFLKYCAFGLVASTVASVVDFDPDQEKNETKDEDKIITGIDEAFESEKVDKLLVKGVNENHNSFSSYVRTVIESVLQYHVAKQSGEFLSKKGIENGNQSFNSTEFAKKYGELATFGAMCVGAPLVEEYLFRLAVSEAYIPNKNKDYCWGVGVPSAVIFALSHNLKFEIETSRVKIDYIFSVPVQQTIAGLYFWHAFRRRGGGYLHALLAHSVNNAICYGSGYLKRKRTSKENPGNKPD